MKKLKDGGSYQRKCNCGLMRCFSQELKTVGVYGNDIKIKEGVCV